jgi:hypothetical protein
MLGPRMALGHMYHTWSVYSNILRSHQQCRTDALLPRKNAPDSTSQPSWVAHGTCLNFSPNTTIEAMRWSQSSVDSMLLGLLGPYYEHAISTFNTYSRGLTHRSLSDTGGGYNLGGASLSHHTPRPSQLMVLCFPPKAPAQSRVKHPTITSWTKEEQTLNLVSGSLHSTSTAIYHLIIALLMVNHQDRVNKGNQEGWS